ncbi:MAG: winged helix-turn-helix transcriptional regulator [Armatimonadota bacterium]|nr:MAG: winged helix-turn-helix transcriptional regulator [Armatimonadota bacterium]
MRSLNRILRALADPTRVRILALLDGRDELCVCEIVDALRLPQYAVSRHLRALRAVGLVSARRQGRWMHYRLHRDMRAADRALAAAVCARAQAESAVRADVRRLTKCLRPRRGRTCRIVSEREPKETSHRG